MNHKIPFFREVILLIIVFTATEPLYAFGAKKKSRDENLIHVRDRSDDEDEGEPAAPGKEIVLGRSDETYQRHPEGDIAQLADNSLLAVWTRHSNRSDLSESIIVGRRSYNLGMSWGGIETYASLSEAEHRTNSNLMDASLLRLQSSYKVLLVYLGKEKSKRVVMMTTDRCAAPFMFALPMTEKNPQEP